MTTELEDSLARALRICLLSLGDETNAGDAAKKALARYTEAQKSEKRIIDDGLDDPPDAFELDERKRAAMELKSKPKPKPAVAQVVDVLRLLYDVYHAAWHAMDDGEEVENGISNILSADLSAAMDVLEAAFPAPEDMQHTSLEQLREAVSPMLAAQGGQDMVLVPREPTEAMIAAAVDIIAADADQTYQELFRLGYKAMLAAAPPSAHERETT